MNKITINTLRKMKSEKSKAVWVTAYDYPQARLVKNAGVDLVLVGDSAGNTTHGFDSTLPMTMEMMLVHSAAVARGVNKNEQGVKPFLVGDMPYMSYQPSTEEAIRNAGAFVKTGMHAIKLEGYLPDTVSAISQAGILVCGHLGLTPQSTAQFGGYRVQGKTKDNADKILEQALDLEMAGLDFLLLEAMPPEPSQKIAEQLMIPVYGIGAGDKVDGQLIILHDLLGLSFEFKCKFVKKYVDGETILTNALKEYADEVRTGKFPTSEHFYEEKS